MESNTALKAQVQTMFIRVLPDRLPTGEAVIYLEMRRHQPSVYSTEQTVQTWHYLIMSTIMKYPELARIGFVLTANMDGAAYGNLDLGVPEAISSAISNSMPVRMVIFFIIKPPFMLQMVIPVIKLILSSKLGQRVHVITDTLTLYEEHGLDPMFFPEEVGGKVSVEKTQENISALLSDNLRI
jgi:hypothetical protein